MALTRVENLGNISILILNRPEKRNALSPELIESLRDDLNRIKDDNKTKVVILSGAGSAFCAGADLAYLQKLSNFSSEENLEDSRNLAKLFREIYELPKVTIAMVNGAALAGGCGLALCCDYIFAAQSAKFGFTEVRIGFIPAIVMNFLIRKIPAAAAYHMALDGRIISAEQALAVNLAEAIYQDEALRENTIAFAGNLIQQNSFEAMMQTKNLFRELGQQSLDTGLETASRRNADSRKTSDCQKGLNAFLNKKKINWRE